MSEGKALTTIIGISTATMVIARLTGELDMVRFRTVLDNPALVRDVSTEPAPDEQLPAAEPAVGKIPPGQKASI
jgi:hypothetical protein